MFAAALSAILLAFNASATALTIGDANYIRLRVPWHPFPGDSR